MKRRGEVERAKTTDFKISVNGFWKFKERLCVPNVEEIKK